MVVIYNTRMSAFLTESVRVRTSFDRESSELNATSLYYSASFFTKFFTSQCHSSISSTTVQIDKRKRGSRATLDKDGDNSNTTLTYIHPVDYAVADVL